MPLSIHRKEQWDLDCVPWICVHRRTPNSSTRVFCVWRGGIQIGSLYLTLSDALGSTAGIRLGSWYWPKRKAS